MKQLLLSTCILISILNCTAQKLYFQKSNYSDSIQFEKNISYLAKQVSELYKDANATTYYNNLFRIQLVAGDYEAAMQSLKKSDWLDHGDSISPSGLESPYKMFIKSLLLHPTSENFNNIYTKIFRDYYKTLNLEGKKRLEDYFENDISEMNYNFQEKKKALSNTDSLTINEAVQLCRTYCIAITYRATIKISNEILAKMDQENYFINDSVLIKMPDGGNISLCIARPKNISGPSPVVLIYNIYSSNSIYGCKEAIKRGYIGIEANTRGKRLSTDTIEPFEHDAKDAYYIIDWISKQPWCNGKIGMYGGSYLGFSQWSAVKYLHPALKTIVPQVAVGVGIDYPSHNNIFMTYMLRWIHYVQNNKYTDDAEFNDETKWNNTFGKWYKNGSSYRSLDTIEGRPNKIFQRWLMHPGYDNYWKQMTPQKEEFAKINIPIFTTTGYYDDDQIGAMYYYHEYQKWNKNPNYYLLIGPYKHGGAQGYPQSEIGGYSIDTIGKIPIMDIVFKWFDHILKDSSRPAILKDKVNFEIMGKNEWKHVSSIDKMHNDSLRFYFGNIFSNNKYSLLSLKPTKLDFISQTVDFKDRKETLFVGDNMGSYPLLLDTAIKAEKEKMIFISEPVETPFAISGALTASIVASINKKDMDIVLDLFELTPEGKYLALNQNLQRASYAKDRLKRQLLQPNKIETIHLSHTYITSRQLQKGSRIVILMGVNKNPAWQINYGTGKDVSNETIKDAAIPFQIKWYNSSYVTIPILR